MQLYKMRLFNKQSMRTENECHKSKKSIHYEGGFTQKGLCHF